jgi:hypothetical protein
LIEIVECGRRRTVWQCKIDKGYLRRYGIELPLSSKHEAFKWLTRGMQKVSRHDADVERAAIDVKILLYPRDDLNGVSDLLPG